MQPGPPALTPPPRAPWPLPWKSLLMWLLLLAGVVVARVGFEAHGEERAARAAEQAGDRTAQLEALERALHWYLPWSGHVPRSAEALFTLGQAAEARGESAEALEAYEALRSGLFAARSFYVPQRAWFDRANDRIATLRGMDRSSHWPDPALSDAERKAILLAQLEQDLASDPGWSAVAVVGFLGWVGCAIVFCLRAIGPDGRFVSGEGRRWGLGILVAYVVWIVGLMRA